MSAGGVSEKASDVELKALSDKTQRLIDGNFNTTVLDATYQRAIDRIKAYNRIKAECPKIFNVSKSGVPSQNFESKFANQVLEHKNTNSSSFVLTTLEYQTMTKITDKFNKLDQDLRQNLASEALIKNGNNDQSINRFDKIQSEFKNKNKNIQNLRNAVRNAYSTYQKAQKKNSSTSAKPDVAKANLIKATNDLISASTTFQDSMEDFLKELEEFNKIPIIKDLLNSIMKIMITYKKNSLAASEEILSDIVAMKKSVASSIDIEKKMSETKVTDSRMEEEEIDEENENSTENEE